MTIQRASKSNRSGVKGALIAGIAAAVLSISAGISGPAWGQAVDKITTSPKVYSLNVCESRQFKATVKGKDGKSIKDAKVIWESTNPGVAKIDGEGVVIGVSPGYTFIRPRVGQIKGTAASLFIRNKGTNPSC
ncbi:MAG TPA: Ig-like domain-containing protein [Nitrospiria bacterium]